VAPSIARVGDECPRQGWGRGWLGKVSSGQVSLGYLGAFSCKLREIDEKVPNFFAVGLNSLFEIWPSAPLILSALMSKKPADLKISDLMHPTLIFQYITFFLCQFLLWKCKRHSSEVP